MGALRQSDEEATRLKQGPTSSKLKTIQLNYKKPLRNMRLIMKRTDMQWQSF
jgi:hypothetical protein